MGGALLVELEPADDASGNPDGPQQGHEQARPAALAPATLGQREQRVVRRRGRARDLIAHEGVERARPLPVAIARLEGQLLQQRRDRLGCDREATLRAGVASPVDHRLGVGSRTQRRRPPRPVGGEELDVEAVADVIDLVDPTAPQTRPLAELVLPRLQLEAVGGEMLPEDALACVVPRQRDADAARPALGSARRDLELYEPDDRVLARRDGQTESPHLP